MRRLPPLNSLRAFEAAARHLSFTKAADELAVTPGAISQQVKLLEETTGVPLFHRNARGLTLTEAGLASLPSLRDGFDRLDAAVRLMNLERKAGRLAVSVAPSFASKWLVPRLDRFQSKHPRSRSISMPAWSWSISRSTMSMSPSGMARGITRIWSLKN